MMSDFFGEGFLENDFNEPKSVQDWTEKEIRIATKNLLRDNTCDNCKHSIYCPLKQNKYNTCYKYEESNINDILRIVRQSYPTMISNEIVEVQPMASMKKQIYHLKYVKNTPFRRIINKVKSIFIKRMELY